MAKISSVTISKLDMVANTNDKMGDSLNAETYFFYKMPLAL